ncbi:Malonate-semialdehyde dehydrogenase [Castellaniella defragrans]
MSEIRRIPLFIGGELVQSASKEWRDIIDPATQRTLMARIPLDAEELNRAVGNAAEAFESWRNVSQAKRQQVMINLARLLREHATEIAEVLSHEHGKTVPDAEGEVGRGIEAVEHAITVNTLQLGEYAENAATGIDVYSIIQPLGVCAGITAFNFPVMLPCWMFPVAVTVGNTFVLKPSEQDPSASLMIGGAAGAGGGAASWGVERGARGEPRRPTRCAITRRSRRCRSLVRARVGTHVAGLGGGQAVPGDDGGEEPQRDHAGCGSRGGVEFDAGGGFWGGGRAVHGDLGAGAGGRGAEVAAGLCGAGEEAEGQRGHGPQGGPWSWSRRGPGSGSRG